MDSLGDSFSVTLLTGPGPPVMLLRSREGRKADQQNKSQKNSKSSNFQFTAAEWSRPRAVVWWMKPCKTIIHLPPQPSGGELPS